MNLDFSNSKFIELYTPSEAEAKKYYLTNKGWSYSYVYSLRTLKDIYILIKYSEDRSLQNLTEKIKINVEPENKSWTDRKVLEYLNALKNFKLIDSNNNIIKDVFNTSKLGNSLTDSDKMEFKNIYFSYFRFLLILSWFIKPNSFNPENNNPEINEETLCKCSKALYFYPRNSRFADTFFYELKNNANLYYLVKNESKNDEDLMRFWDVFIKWGQELSLLERYNLKDLDIYMLNSSKSINLIYFINNNFRSFDLKEFLMINFVNNYIKISDIVLKIAQTHRYSLTIIKEYIIKEAIRNRDIFDLQRTSDRFIKKNELHFIPKHNDYFISHILIK